MLNAGKPVQPSVSGVLLCLFAFTIWSGLATARTLSWHHLDQGLELVVQSPSDRHGETPDLVLLRIDPDVYDFKLLTASQLDVSPLGIDAWVRLHGLTAAINASMYWQDQATSTGYMRTQNHINNSRVHPWFGAFFLTDPKSDGEPPVRLLDRGETKDWQTVIAGYHTVIQNYRIISQAGTNAWMESSNRFSIAAVGQDDQGRILFILSIKPRQVRELGQHLIGLPLDLRTTMYVEGGPTASLYVKVPEFERGWTGLDDFAFWPAATDDYRALPNVIGIVKRIVSIK